MAPAAVGRSVMLDAITGIIREVKRVEASGSTVATVVIRGDGGPPNRGRGGSIISAINFAITNAP